MHHEFRELGTATNRRRALIFIHGFQGHYRTLGWRTTCASWSRGLRAWGYEGRIFAFRWYSSVRDALRADRDWRAEEAAGALWDFINDHELRIQATSLLGFSLGGSIIHDVLRHAACNDIRFRRVYFVGAAPSRNYRWRRLVESATNAVWNFHSDNDQVLKTFHSDAIGLYGFHQTYNYFYPNARDVDCASFIDRHDEWGPNFRLCLWQARLSGGHL